MSDNQTKPRKKIIPTTLGATIMSIPGLDYRPIQPGGVPYSYYPCLCLKILKN